MEPYAAYLDDSGTDTHSRARIVAAALCLSPVSRWMRFEKDWIKAENKYGFRNFHMTSFAGCNRDSWCRDCKSGRTTLSDHPWRQWSKTKRHDALESLIHIVCEHTEQGFGLSFLKRELDGAIKHPHLLAAAPPGEYPADYYTFTATACAGELAKWRFRKKSFPPLKLVFDGDHKLELAKAFSPEYQSKPRLRPDGMENWFQDCGITFESRKKMRQLLAADMLAWVTAKIRIAMEFPTTYRRMKGWGKEVTTIAYSFIRSGKLHPGGYFGEGELEKWLRTEIEFWEKHSKKEAGAPHLE